MPRGCANPFHPEQPSLNLAQSVAIFGYCLRHQALSIAGSVGTPRREATVEELSQVGEALRVALERSGFLDPDQPRHAVRDLVRTFERGRLGRQEARLWMSALRSLSKEVGRKPPRTSSR